ncbi:putative sporulation protein (polysaccharide deacetylase family) [Scopulibacillus daqui]|uniref:Sporulation protein (Polysaccharide deacetylase family) n=1 Tax=Scopulibacillus daqui TaxID=1469162 RepID=A0ABS2PXF7_9BACL|nr:polysaccharide deacetylase family protein [Scopulibacillus daqui]MBM7644395.1 putative sporulation protein (polysaccharide deacetylase family) [Scopulibacillus daqui]
MQKQKWHFIVFVCLLMLTFGTIMENPYMNAFLTPKSTPAAVPAVSAGNHQDSLLKKIEVFSKKHEIKPIDAVNDRVWKATPGYNGLAVDINASYQKMKAKHKFNENDIVYKEVPPTKSLSDLPPSPIYRGNPKKPMVALLINVAWGNEYIPQILKVLNKYNIKATFFLDGSWVKKYPDLAMMISEQGHEIGNHAYSHPDLKQRSEQETFNELKKTNDVIEATLDVKPKWFAPPSGSFTQQTVNVAHKLGMKTILWTVDTVDWKKPQTMEMVRRVVPRTTAGTMILMHPTKPVAEGLEQIINGIQEKGYKFGTVSQLMSEKRIDPLK